MSGNLEFGQAVTYGAVQEPWQLEAAACMTVMPQVFPSSRGWECIDIDICKIDFARFDAQGGAVAVSALSSSEERKKVIHAALVVYDSEAHIEPEKSKHVREAANEAVARVIAESNLESEDWSLPEVSVLPVPHERLLWLEMELEDDWERA
jgi:hypothetical protein